MYIISNWLRKCSTVIDRHVTQRVPSNQSTAGSDMQIRTDCCELYTSRTHLAPLEYIVQLLFIYLYVHYNTNDEAHNRSRES